MGFLNYLKGVKEAFQEIREKGPGFPVDLDGPFVKFMLDIQDGDHYIALDTNVICNKYINFFSTNHKSKRFVVSQHTINMFQHSVNTNDENAEIAAYALEKVQRALEEGYKISFVSVTEEEIYHLGFESSFSAAVNCSFYKAKREIESIHKDWRTLYFVTLPTEEESILIANSIQLPTYVIKN